jgi:signal transduction histidine kinase
LSGDSQEIVASPHASRDGQERIAAGVRRARGGAIVLNAANRAAAELDQVYSLSSLLQQMAAATPAIAYIVLDEADRQVAHGALVDLAPPPDSAMVAGERFQQAGAFGVLERIGAVPLDESREATLRIGMRLDDVRRGERRTLVRIAIVFGSIGALSIAAFALIGLRQRYGELSARHARAEDALARKDRLAAMGEMASTVAHEIRNPLNAIAMSGQRLAREYITSAEGSDLEAVELIDVIRRETGRIEERVQQFLDFARPRPLNRERVQVDSMLRDVAATIRPLAASRDVQIAEALASGLSMRLDADMIRQVLDNVLRNAIEATPAGGRVTLASSARGGTLEIQVRDTGAGIPPDVLPRIFDLYFTTKPLGTGVGLAVAQQIVAAHGGTMDAESTEGGGTVMTVRLPERGGSDA